MKKSLLVFFCFTVLLYSCGVSIFEIFSPKSASDTDNVQTLVELGNAKLREGDYEGAYNAFDKVLKIQPDNSYALEGISTAYLGMKLSFEKIIELLSQKTNKNFGEIILTLYDVSGFVYDKISKIVENKADGKISPQDVNVNFTMLIFGTFYGVFHLADTDGDRNIRNDSDDVIIIKDNLEIEENVGSITTNFFGTLKLLKNLCDRLDEFDTIFSTVFKAKNNLYNNFENENIKQIVSNIGDNLTSVKTNMDVILDRLAVDTNINRIQFVKMLGNSSITNLGEFFYDIVDDVLLLYMTNSGVTDYDTFTKLVYYAGYTNNRGEATTKSFTENLTNYFPDLGPAYTNIYQTLTNYYGQ